MSIQYKPAGGSTVTVGLNPPTVLSIYACPALSIFTALTYFVVMGELTPAFYVLYE